MHAGTDRSIDTTPTQHAAVRSKPEPTQSQSRRNGVVIKSHQIESIRKHTTPPTARIVLCEVCVQTRSRKDTHPPPAALQSKDLRRIAPRCRHAPCCSPALVQPADGLIQAPAGSFESAQRPFGPAPCPSTPCPIKWPRGRRLLLPGACHLALHVPAPSPAAFHMFNSIRPCD